MPPRTRGFVQKPQSPVRVAENFINTYGRPRLLRLIEMLRAHTSGPEIAHEFKVSRQRVHQWKTQLGEERVLYVLDEQVEKILVPKKSNLRTTV